MIAEWSQTDPQNVMAARVPATYAHGKAAVIMGCRHVALRALAGNDVRF